MHPASPLRIAALLLLAATLACTPSCGTVMTRMASASARGCHYPAKSIVEDFRMIGLGVIGAEQPGGDLMGMGARGSALGGLVSLPIDLVLDAVLLPLDLIDVTAHLLGHRRGW